MEVILFVAECSCYIQGSSLTVSSLQNMVNFLPFSPALPKQLSCFLIVKVTHLIICKNISKHIPHVVNGSLL